VGILRLHDRFATATLADATTPIVRFLGAVAVWLVAPSAIAFLAVWALAEAVTATAYWVSALRLPQLAWKLDRPWRWSEIWEENPGIRAYALTTNLLYSLDAGAKQLTILLVGLIAAPAAAGRFRFAQQLAQAMGKLSQMMARAIFPELMRSRAGDAETGHFERLLSRTIKLTATGGALVFLLLLVAGRPAIDLIAGREFVSAYPILLTLGTAAALDFAAAGFEPALAALGRAGLALRLRIVSTIILFGLLAILGPHYGALGAAIAVLGASFASALLLWITLKRLTRR
jgi:O-antigen/teichoic acid export membrane protein